MYKKDFIQDLYLSDYDGETSNDVDINISSIYISIHNLKKLVNRDNAEQISIGAQILIKELTKLSIDADSILYRMELEDD